LIVYLVHNRVNGKVYIGQTMRSLATRWSEHKSDAIRNCGEMVLHHAIRKYGPEAFEVRVLCTADTPEQLNFKEQFYIARFDSLHRDRGYNRAPGGAMQMTLETCRKISLAMKGRTAHNKGKKMSQDQRVKISRACMGRASGFKGTQIRNTTTGRFVTGGALSLV
jgi:group I intron endonuclease